MRFLPNHLRSPRLTAAARAERDLMYDIKRRRNAMRSGIGARECARRVRQRLRQYPYEYTSSSLLPGWYLDPQTGAIAGTFTEEGSFTVTVSDAAGQPT